MYEGIGRTVVTRDEAEALHGVEELDRAHGLFAGQLARGRSRFFRHGQLLANDLQIRRRNLAAPVDQVEGEFLPFGQPVQPGTFHLADMDKHVFPAIIPLDEAEALAGIEEFYLALASADDLHGHAAPRAAASATAAKTATVLAAMPTIVAKAIPSLETVGLVGRHPARNATLHERIETVFTDTVAFVASPPAPFVVTHETEKPCLFALPTSLLHGRTQQAARRKTHPL